MDIRSTKISYKETGYYTRIMLDYLEGNTQLLPFYKHPVNIEGITAAITQRQLAKTDRQLLVNTLQKHYNNHHPTARQADNIRLLQNKNCFTITTAHQPNIFTGHLYFIYKILHTIKLCEQLTTELPGNTYVPVFYMGSEDADLDELGHVYINGVKHTWDTKQTGAVGRMKVDKALLAMIDRIAGELNVQPHGEAITGLMKACYQEGATIEMATFKLVNNLFGKYGVLVLLPDNADFKKAFIPVVKKELLEQFSNRLVEETVAAFPKTYKVQAGGRELNMFYLEGDSRERIVKEGSAFKIQNTDKVFDEKEIMQELEEHPEKFSPNVILRPVFQEMILPNIVFIGGGGELAYWLELKKVFDELAVPFPVMLLRNSFLWVDKGPAAKAVELGFVLTELFSPEEELMNKLVNRETSLRLELEQEKQELQLFYKKLKQTAGVVDRTLEAHTEALEKQALRKILALEKKMLRAEKKKFEARQRQLHKLRSHLFPQNNLQERIGNVMPFFAAYGTEYIDALYDHSSGLKQEFTVLEVL